MSTPNHRPASAVLALVLGLSLLPTGPVLAEQIRLDPALAQPYLLAGQKQATYLRVGLDAKALRNAERPPVNVSIVIDRSGSMSGQKLRRAKEAAIMAVDRLHPDDIISVVAYDHKVTVLVPATKARDRANIVAGIRRLYAGGNTALFAGVSKGAEEVRKFAEPNRVNRVVLLSDGLANVGPSSPSELGSLGGSLGREGIGVTTIGLGLDYNEDLMTQLAQRSEGNHFFAATAADLRRGFELEFGVGLAVAAKEIAITVECAKGIRPIRVINTEADIFGRKVIAHLSQIYASRQAYVLLEVEVPAGEAGGVRDLAKVSVSYASMQSMATENLSRRLSVRFSGSPAVVERNINRPVMADVMMHLANERYKMALELRDQGKIHRAREVLQDNARLLEKQSRKYKSQRLYDFSQSNYRSMGNLEKKKWKKERKQMRDEQLELDEPAAAY